MIHLGTLRLGPGREVIPFQPSHIYSIELKPFELEYVNTIPDFYNYAIENAFPNLSWTGIGHGQIQLIWGVRPFFEKTAEVWMLPGKNIDRYAVSLLRCARQMLKQVMKEHGFERLQITVRQQNVTAYKFAKALYFEDEGLLRKYGPEGADYIIMSRIE